MAVHDIVMSAAGAGGDRNWVATTYDPQAYNPAVGYYYPQHFPKAILVKDDKSIAVAGHWNQYTNYSALYMEYSSSGTVTSDTYIYKSTSLPYASGGYLAKDSSGNTYRMGSAYTGAGFSYPVFVQKLDSAGVQQWCLSDGSGALGWELGVNVSASGNIYAAVNVSGTTAFISKFNSTPTIQFTTRVNAGAPRSVALDASENSYVVTASGVIVKVNSSGALVWSKTLSSSGNLYNYSANGVAVDGSGNVYVVGRITTKSNNTYKAFIAKLDSSGNLTWSKLLMSGAGQGPSGYFTKVTVDSNGNAYAIGDYYNRYESQYTIDYYYGIVAKYNSSGSLVWQRAYLEAGTAPPKMNACAIDSKKNLVVSGGFGYYDATNNPNYQLMTSYLLADGSCIGTYGNFTISDLALPEPTSVVTLTNGGATVVLESRTWTSGFSLLTGNTGGISAVF